METVVMNFRIPPTPAKYARHNLASRAFDVRYAHVLKYGGTEEEALEDATNTADRCLQE